MSTDALSSEQNKPSQTQIDCLAEALEQALGYDAVSRNVALRNYTTFKVGGPAALFVEPTTEQDVAETVALCHEHQIPYWLLGCGSNVLVSDDGLRGVVIHLGDNYAAIDVDAFTTPGTIVAQAGATNEDVAQLAAAAGLAGFEFASGIPGSIGGAAIMNAGAYDGEFKDVATSVRCLTTEGAIVDVDADQADWSYRHSMMMDKGWVVLSATLQLHPDDPAAIQARIDELTQRRSSKQPLEMASAGSTFKRPEGYFAGPLIQEAGMQGHCVGGAMVSDKHAGFVVNTGEATANDIVQLIGQVQQAVLETSGVQLQPEVRMWGFE